MRIIAIDTSSRSLSVSILDGQVVVFQLDSGVFPEQRDTNASLPAPESGGNAGGGDQLPPGYVKKRSKRGSKTSRVFAPGASVLLAPMIQECFEKANMTARDIELVAIAVGPGMFTGLRVGVVTAKSLAYSIGAELIGVNTLEVIAGQAIVEMQSASQSIKSRQVDCPVVKPVLNAQRKQLFCGEFRLGERKAENSDDSQFDWKIIQSAEDVILDRDEWINSLQPNDILTGTGLQPILDQIQSEHPEVVIAPESVWESSATSVGKLAWSQYQGGKRDDLWKLEPVYFRPSAAEEVRNAKNG